MTARIEISTVRGANGDQLVTDVKTESRPTVPGNVYARILTLNKKRVIYGNRRSLTQWFGQFFNRIFSAREFSLGINCIFAKFFRISHQCYHVRAWGRDASFRIG